MMFRVTFFAFIMLLTSCTKAQDISIELFAQGFNSPVELSHAGDQRVFVVEQNGKIKILNSDGSVNSLPFLDLSDLVSTGGERGLLGLAFAPDYPETGRFYVNYTDVDGNSVIARYHVSSDPDIADTAAEILLTYEQPFTNHNGGSLHFGDDGYLWISTGDGGSGGDPFGNGQNTEVLLGKLLRIDVSGESYAIPPDNPFVEGSAPEIWAYGLRNPWKFSFDRETGELLIADVGQNQYEEVNREPANAAGLNYGWRCYEGNNPYNTTGCGSPDDMIFPIAVYSHSNGRCSITGGYVYRGNKFYNLVGKYIFGDYCSGEIGWIDQDNNLEFVLNTGINLTSFGQDAEGELYVLGSGKVYKIKGLEMGIGQVEKDKISVYPNPVRDFLTLETDIPINRVSVYSVDGKLLKNFNQPKSNRIDFSNFPSGIYIIKVISGNLIKSIKVTRE